MLKKQRNVPSIWNCGSLWFCSYLYIHIFSLFFFLRKYDYHFLLLWGLGHCQDMNINFQFKNISWDTFIILRFISLLLFIILRFTCCSFLEIEFWIFWHFPLERRFLWIIGALRKVTTPLPSVHPQNCLCTQTPHWRQHNLGEVLFFFFPYHWELGKGGGAVRCMGLCLSPEDELTVI